MPILSEDVIIRLLVDTNKGVADLKKAGTATQNLMKSALKMAVAMGGAALAFELVVKAITSYITYIKDAEVAAVKFAKESGRALDDSVEAYDRLNAAVEENKRVNGLNHLIFMENHRERRAARLEESALLNGLTNEQTAALTRYNVQAKKDGEEMLSRLEWAIKLVDEQRAYLEGLDELRRKVEENRRVNAVAAEEELAATRTQAAEDDKESTRLAAEAAEAERLRLAAIERLKQGEKELRDEIIQNETDILNTKMDAHNANMAMIQDEKDLRMQAALDVLNGWSNTLGAISSLVSQSYQNQIDAAEDGSEKQKELMRRQFNAEKAMAIVQSLIATAVGVTRSIPNVPLMIFSAAAGAIQTATIAATQAPSFALGTSSSGYTVPPGYEGDTAAVYAKSGETVHVDRPGSGGEMLTANISIDGYQFGTVVTRLFKDRKATVPADVVIS